MTLYITADEVEKQKIDLTEPLCKTAEFRSWKQQIYWCAAILAGELDFLAGEEAGSEETKMGYDLMALELRKIRDALIASRP